MEMAWNNAMHGWVGSSWLLIAPILCIIFLIIHIRRHPIDDKLWVEHSVKSWSPPPSLKAFPQFICHIRRRWWVEKPRVWGVRVESKPPSQGGRGRRGVWQLGYVLGWLNKDFNMAGVVELGSHRSTHSRFFGKGHPSPSFVYPKQPRAGGWRALVGSKTALPRVRNRLRKP